MVKARIGFVWTVALACIGTVASAQSVRLGWIPDEGERATCRARLSVDVDQTIGEEVQPTQRLEHFAQLALEGGATREDGSTLVNVSIELLAIAGDGADAGMSFVGGDADVLAELPGMEAASSGETIRALGRALVESEITLAVTPEGEVRSVTGLEKFLETFAGQEDLDERVLGFFTPEKLADMLGPVFGADGARTRTLEEGKGWQTVERVGLDRAGALEMITNWRVASVTDEETVVEGELEIDLLVPSFRDEATPVVELGDYSGETVSRWSTRSGRLIERRGEMTIDTVWTLGDLTVSQHQESVSLLEFGVAFDANQE